MDIKQWWNKRSGIGKLFSVVGVCVIGFLLLGFIAGMLMPENTGNVSYQSTQSDTGNGTVDSAPAGVNRTAYPDTGIFISRGDEWSVTLDKYNSSFSKSEALSELESRKQIEQNYSISIQQTTKTVNGVTVYSLSWTRQHENIHREIFFFEKNGNWYKMDIEDRTGTNTDVINSEIKYYMNKA